MLPGIELMHCDGLAVPATVMEHVVSVESSHNPFAIGVVGGRLARQPNNLQEAVATVRMLETQGYNFSVGLAQVNRYNLGPYGLDSYEKAFETCANVQAGSRILAECYDRANGDWGKSFSCYYSGNFTTGFRHGYVQKVYASMRKTAGAASEAQAIAVIDHPARRASPLSMKGSRAMRRTLALAPSRAPTQSLAATNDSTEATAARVAVAAASSQTPVVVQPTAAATHPPPTTTPLPADRAFVF